MKMTVYAYLRKIFAEENLVKHNLYRKCQRRLFAVIPGKADFGPNAVVPTDCRFLLFWFCVYVYDDV